ncbi:Glucan endo-1 [Diplonema papillatum]|nr:Glucan endo-1 [Diplonema papillatum]
MEAVNLNVGGENRLYGTLHYGKDWPKNSHSGTDYVLPGGADASEGYHVYTVEWEEGEVRWYVDGVLFQTQLKSEVERDASGEPVSLKRKGWFHQVDNSLVYDNSPFSERFHILLNLAVGGGWAGTVNDKGVDSSAFANGQFMHVDYVRVYRCTVNPATGKGCATVTDGYLDRTFVEGVAPVITPGSTRGLITTGTLVVFESVTALRWKAFDCCGGTTPSEPTDTYGKCVEFTGNTQPSVFGFVADDMVYHDATAHHDDGVVQFQMRVVQAPNVATKWLFKIETNNNRQAAELDLTQSREGVAPVVGVWQTYTFSLSDLVGMGIDHSHVSALFVFPAWGTADGAVFRLDNFFIGVRSGQPGVPTPPLTPTPVRTPVPVAPTPTPVSVATPVPQQVPQGSGGRWEMVWNDEFEGTSIDSTKWNHEINCDGGGNAEQQCYTADAANSWVSDGVLTLKAMPASGMSQPYSSARLNSKYKGDWKYGRFEARIKLPFGQGSWPAFWMLPTDSMYGEWPKSGEIDIMEAVNLNVRGENRLYGTLHYGKDWPKNSHSGTDYVLPGGADATEGYHIYAVEWEEGEVRWYVDGVLFQTQLKSEVETDASGEPVSLKRKGWFHRVENSLVYDNSPFTERFYIILNLAVGGGWAGTVNDKGVDSSAFANGQFMHVDYVRVYRCTVNPATGKGCATVTDGYLDRTFVEGVAPVITPGSTRGLITTGTLVVFESVTALRWKAFDCCGGTTPSEPTDTYGKCVEFTGNTQPSVFGFVADDMVYHDATAHHDDGVVQFQMRVVQAPNVATKWLFKIETNNNRQAAELDLTQSREGVAPVVGVWQTYTFSLSDLVGMGIDPSHVSALFVFPAWGTADGAVFRLDNFFIGVRSGQPSVPTPPLTPTPVRTRRSSTCYTKACPYSRSSSCTMGDGVERRV